MIRKTIIVVLTLGAVGTIALWVRSHWIMDYVLVPTSRQWYVCFSSRLGNIEFGHEFDSERTGVEGFSIESSDVSSWVEATTRMQGYFREANRSSGRSARFDPDRSFRYLNMMTTYDGLTFGGRSFAFPHWLLAILFAAYPTIALTRGPLRRWRRHRKGLCRKCGYNLTGNVTGRCSECGTEVNPS